MTPKRDSKDKPKQAERPKIKKEKLKDLDSKDTEVKGGQGVQTRGACCTQRHSTWSG